MVTKISMGNYISDTYRDAKFHSDLITKFCSCFGCWQIANPKAFAPILTLNTPKVVVSRKDICAYWGPENEILYFDPIFPGKNDINFNYKSGI